MLTSQITPLLHQQIIYPTYFFSSLQTHVSISCRLCWAFFSIWVLFWVCLNERFILYQPHITTLYCHTFNSLFLVFPPWTLMLKNVSYNLNAVANIFLSKWILCYLNSGGAMPCLLRFYFWMAVLWGHLDYGVGFFSDEATIEAMHSVVMDIVS